MSAEATPSGTRYFSSVNSFTGVLTIDNNFEGDFDDISEFSAISVWIYTPDEIILKIHYSDVSDSEHSEQTEITELYQLNNGYNSIYSQSYSKGDYARIILTNVTGLTLPRVEVTTNFWRDMPQSYLNHNGSYININPTIVLGPINEQEIAISHEESDVLIYGSDNSFLVNPEGICIIEHPSIGGSGNNGFRDFNTNTDGDLLTETNISGINVSLDNIIVTQDDPVNLQSQSYYDVPLSVMFNGVPINSDNSVNLKTQSHLSVPLLCKAFPVEISVSQIHTEAYLNSSVDISLTDLVIMQDISANFKMGLNMPITMASVQNIVTVEQGSSSNLKCESSLKINDLTVSPSNRLPVNINNPTVKIKSVASGPTIQTHIDRIPITYPLNSAQLYDGTVTAMTQTGSYPTKGSTITALMYTSNNLYMEIQGSYDETSWYTIYDQSINGNDAHNFNAAVPFLRCQLTPSGSTDVIINLGSR